MLKSVKDLEMLVNEIGFLPLFHSERTPYSVEGMTPGQWWTGEADDPWGWREAAAREGNVLYGKFFQGRAGFISREWFPDFANLRRDGYDFDSRWEEGLETPKAHEIMAFVEQRGFALTCEIKRATGAKGFEAALTALQNKSYCVIDGFERRRNKRGEPYGWNIARITTPEIAFGADWVKSKYDIAPETSGKRILAHLVTVFPEISEDDLQQMIAN